MKTNQKFSSNKYREVNLNESKPKFPPIRIQTRRQI